MTFFINEQGFQEKVEKAPDNRLAFLKAALEQGLLEGVDESLAVAVADLQAARAAHVASKVDEVQAAGYRINPTVPGFVAYKVKMLQGGGEVFDEGLPGVPGLAEATSADQAWTAVVKKVRPYPAELFER